MDSLEPAVRHPFPVESLYLQESGVARHPDLHGGYFQPRLGCQAHAEEFIANQSRKMRTLRL
jgi:hypothetical protein